MTSEQIAQLSDKELHARCQNCGYNIRKFQKEFACYLPEVERRRLHRKYGFYSLYEYAGKIAGMNHATVDSIISVHKKLSDKPVLKNLMDESGWGKLKVMAAIATPDTQSFWAEKIKEMSKATLVTFLQELRKQESDAELIHGKADEGTSIQAGNVQIDLFTNPTDVPGPGTGSGKPTAVSQKTTFAFKLDDETQTKLRIFKQRLEKKTHEPKDWNEVIKELLEIAKQHGHCAKKPRKEAPNAHATEKTEPKPESGMHTMLEETKKSLPAVSTRYIPLRVKNYLLHKFSGICAFPGCKNPSEINHHTKRFVLEPHHDPDSIIPLCKNHERIAHHGLIKNEEQMPEYWKIQLEPDRNSPKYTVDRIVQRHRVTM